VRCACVRFEVCRMFRCEGMGYWVVLGSGPR
jgi:hypothetical protein